MIYVSFELEEERRKLTMKVQGHAHQDIPGKDIVCASASILAYTLAQNVLYMQAAGKTKYNPTVKLKEGNAIVSVRAKNDADYAELGQLFCHIQTGYQLLTVNYPDFVVLKMFGEADNA